MSKYSIGQFAQRVGKSASTIRRWEQEGKLTSKRHPSGHRYFDESDVSLVLGYPAKKRLTVVYCRVSSANQKNELEMQIKAMEQFCLAAGISVDEWIKEIAGGTNFKRQGFLSLVDRMLRGEIAHCLIAHQDRLTRFGFDLLEHLAQNYGCQLTVVNQESLSPQQELVTDLLAVIQTFSCRLDGLRKYKKQIQEDYPDCAIKKQKNVNEPNPHF